MRAVALPLNIRLSLDTFFSGEFPQGCLFNLIVAICLVNRDRQRGGGGGGLCLVNF